VEDEEAARRELVNVAGKDRDRRGIRGRGRLAFVDPLADQDLERVMASVTDRCLAAVLSTPAATLTTRLDPAVPTLDMVAP
jgi:hypothetical protein